MKKFLIALAILVGIAAICVITCPDKQTHVDGLNEIVKEALYQRSQESLKNSLDAIDKREKKFYEGEKKRKNNHSELSTELDSGLDLLMSMNPNGPRRSFDAEREVSKLMYDGPIESSTAESFILRNIEVDNHFIFSLGYMENETGRKVVSFGIFGHVFTNNDLSLWASILEFDGKHERDFINFFLKK